ncbi:hypothetical protein BV22DRAFT_325296 [Leucogyrophana mollusca]|uniref:Uncharacterized protein n=1 Tax=Leucogyrophana mollusca TaxID=85980 RepID=A0ACB8BLT1_9AGAM|nr:hypothetical protein BV22DRAFT_325296 [Leucogyrophana mollusca]
MPVIRAMAEIKLSLEFVSARSFAKNTVLSGTTSSCSVQPRVNHSTCCARTRSLRRLGRRRCGRFRGRRSTRRPPRTSDTSSLPLPKALHYYCCRCSMYRPTRIHS